MGYGALLPSTCFICKEGAKDSADFDTEVRLVECVRCGRYYVSPDAQEALHSGSYKEPELARLSSVVRLSTEAQRQVIITPALLPTLIDSVSAPADPMEAADSVLLYLHQHNPGFGTRVSFSVPTDYPLFTLRNPGELSSVINYMIGEKWISITPGTTTPGITLLPAGYARIRQLRTTSKGSRRAFVAMSFASDWNAAYRDGIKPAILQTGFEPIRVDEIPHNEMIDDRIILELRRSAFVVADLSVIRSGVFFEAGFGFGLGLQVIWMCQAATFEEVGKHFDTRQFNYILWATPEDLRERLRSRILATIPGAKELSLRPRE